VTLAAILLAAPLLAVSLAGCNKKTEQAPASEKPVPEAQSVKPEKPTAKAETPPTPPAAPGAMPAPADVAAPPADATKSATGLASKVLQAGTGTEHPAATDMVEVNYTGWTKSGSMFDTSIGRGPAKFPLNGVIKGWTEGLQLMVQGEKRRFWIPADLAYGNTPMRPGAPTGDLTFDVELLSITKMPPPPAVPTDVKAAPASAKKTASGLQYRVLQKGKGTKHPAANSVVEVHYSGWTTDGQMFDSSVTRGQPARFGLNQVIKGWTEGVQLMVEGEKTRFWIPGNMAYGDTPSGGGRPYGLLVFDIELLKIIQ
jgi:peptidylprolyl isomerase